MTDGYLPAGRFTEGEFRIGRVLSKAFSVVARNFLKFILVACTIGLAQLLLSTSSSPLGMSQSGAVRFASSLLLIVLGSLVQAILVHAAGQDMRGQSVSLLASTQVGLRRFFSVVGIWFGAIGAALVLTVGIYFIAGGLTTVLPSLRILIGAIMIISTTISICFLYVSWFAAVPASVIEQLGPLQSLRRSRELTKNHRWRLFGLFLLVVISFAVFWQMLGAIVAALAGDSAFSRSALLFGATRPWFFNPILSTVWAAYVSAIIAAVHHDLRAAKDGLGAERILPVFEWPGTASPAFVESPASGRQRIPIPSRRRPNTAAACQPTVIVMNQNLRFRAVNRNPAGRD